MKKIILLLVLAMVLSLNIPLIGMAYDFGDNRSVTLANKAWDALDKSDIEATLAFTNKCIELYAEQARVMQASLKEYPKGASQEGSDKEVFNYWALNDVGTCLFIQGEAYRKAKMDEEAKEAYKVLIDKYSFAQCWDNKGWFWKPAEAAKERISSIETGKSYDFGDDRSETLTLKAWQALSSQDLDAVLVYTNRCIDLYKDKAKEMQVSLKDYPAESPEKIFSYWALNDIGACLFIQGKALRNAKRIEEAKLVFQRIIKEYSFSQCWDPKGWFWKPAEVAQEELAEIEVTKSGTGK